MRDKRWFVAVVQVCVFVALLFCAYCAARRGIGAWYFKQRTPEAIRTAIKWDPNNPEYWNALGTVTHLYSDRSDPQEIIQLYERATYLSPQDAQYWADLGEAYEWAGRKSEALRSYQQALHLFPHSPDINWRAANFYVRTGRISEGLSALRNVLVGGSVPVRQVFALATSATADTGAILDQTIPSRADILFAYLQFQIGTGRIDATKRTWSHLLELNLPFDIHQAGPYLDALIQNRKIAELKQAWSALASRFPTEIPVSVAPDNSITNGSFETEILNEGLDWRVIPTKGATVGLDSTKAFDGAHSLRIQFDGTSNLDYGGVLQYVPVEANTRYKFSAYMRAEDVTTDSGPRMEVFDAYDMGRFFLSTEGTVGNSDWSVRQIKFKTRPETQLLIARVARPPSHKFDSQIAGTVWIDCVRLTPER